VTPRATGALVTLLVAAPAAAQLGGAGFVPAVVPHTVDQAPVLSAGYGWWDGAGGPVARGDFWFGRFGAAASVGSLGRGSPSALRLGASALFEVVTQGVAPRRPGIELQAGYTARAGDGLRDWALPVSAGIFMHAPLPLARGTPTLFHPTLSLRHVVAGSERGTSGGLSLRVVVIDGGWLTNWGAHGYARLFADGSDTGPKWEAALTRVMRRRVAHGG
jgi:hypothetical protein